MNLFNKKKTIEITERQKSVNVLRAMGLNPIRLFGNVYLVRCQSTYYSKWPIYKIKIFKEYPLDK